MAHLSQHDRHRPQGDLRLSERDPTRGCVQQCVRWLPRIFGLGGQSENLRLPEHSRLSKPADAAIGRRTPAFGGFPPALLRPIRRLRSPAGSDNGSGWILAEEAGVEPTEDAWRPPTDLKSARVTGPDTLPRSV